MKELLNNFYLTDWVIQSLMDWWIGLLILILWWIIAKIIATITQNIIWKANFIETTFKKIWVEANIKTISNVISKIIFFIIILFVLVAFFEQVWLESVNKPINNFIETVLPWALSAIWLSITAWLVATISRFLFIKSSQTLNLEEKIDKDTKTNVIKSLSEVIYWFIIIFFLPAILWALWQEELLTPIKNIINNITGAIPTLINASIIFFIWYFIAKILRKITTSSLNSIWADKATEKLWLKDFSISKLAGTIVYIIVLIPIIIETLNKLEIEAISKPATDMMTIMMNALPNIFAAIVIIIISYFIANFLSKLVKELLSGIWFNKILALIGLENIESKTKPSDIIWKLVFIYILLLATIEASKQLGFENLWTIVNNFITFATQILIWIVIFWIWLYLANLASSAISSASKSKILPKIAKIAIIILTTFMWLQQMWIASEIINLAFWLTLGSLAVAAALAIGLWAKDVAWEEVKKLIENLKK